MEIAKDGGCYSFKAKVMSRFKLSPSWYAFWRLNLHVIWFQILAAAQSYGENHVNFTQFGAFSRLCGSLATCVTAGALLLVSRRLHTFVYLTCPSKSYHGEDETFTHVKAVGIIGLLCNRGQTWCVGTGEEAFRGEVSFICLCSDCYSCSSCDWCWESGTVLLYLKQWTFVCLPRLLNSWYTIQIKCYRILLHFFFMGNSVVKAFQLIMWIFWET